MKLTLRIWRQTNADQPGEYQSYGLENVSPTFPCWKPSTSSTSS